MSKSATRAPRGPVGKQPARAKSGAAKKAHAPRTTASKAKAPRKSGGAEVAVVRTSGASKGEAAPRGNGRTGLKLALTLLLMAVIGGVAGVGTWSAFSSTTENTGNTFAAGTVVIGDNDGGSSPMFTFANAKPGQADTPSCITVTYTGSLASSVRLYGTTTSADNLDQYLDLVVTRGSGATGASTWDDCTGFTADAVGVVYSGTLKDFVDNYDAPGIDDGEVWASPESHQYKFEVTLNSAAPNTMQGKSATQTFTWEARNN